MRTYATVAACLVLAVGIYAAVNNNSFITDPAPYMTPTVSESPAPAGEGEAVPVEPVVTEAPEKPQGQSGGVGLDSAQGEPEKPAYTPQPREDGVVSAGPDISAPNPTASPEPVLSLIHI